MNKRFYAPLIAATTIAAALAGCGGGGGGSSSGSAGPFGGLQPNAFQFATTSNPAPVSPTSGVATGGTFVTITGSGTLVAPVKVFFGTSQGTSVNILSNSASSTQLNVLSPAGSGTVDVRIVDGNGVSAITSNDAYTFVPAPPPPPG